MDCDELKDRRGRVDSRPNDDGTIDRMIWSEMGWRG